MFFLICFYIKYDWYVIIQAQSEKAQEDSDNKGSREPFLTTENEDYG